jgi:eukaryotic-like serine/threonine-protein kinase
MTTPGRLASALAERYAIERELGQGGMATVYLAQDLKHHRQVAIKVLKPELAAVLGAERFVQEITTTAQLQHPHILPLFDSGQADGFLYYVMPYIEGETLRTKLDREKQLGIDEAVRITTDVADALDYAHRHGVIHRDIKPENILLHDGRPMVADFGIALAVSAAAGGRMTETGLSLGTPHYMSPEQATADRDITARSDIYSLASVLYEMLTGEPPHMGTSAQQIIMKIIAEPVKPVTELRKSTPPHVAASVTVALEKLPADRFGSAREFAETLQGRGRTLAMPAGSGVRAAAGASAVARHPLVVGLVVALLGAIGFGALEWQAAHRDTKPAVVRFHLDLPSALLLTNAATGTNVAVSPDGRTLAYVLPGENGASSLYLRPLDEGAPHAMAGTDGAQQPCFSPDGRWIAYLVGIVVWKVQVTGGPPLRVGSADFPPVGLTWTSGGLIVAATSAGLFALPQAGGVGRVIVPVDSAAGDAYFFQPKSLPDGRTILFGISGKQGLTRVILGAASLPSDAVTRFNLNVLDPILMVDGRLIYVAPSGVLTAVPIDLRAGKVTGAPVSLGITVTYTAAGASQAALSPAGTFVYQPQNADATVGWVDARRTFEPLLTAARPYAYPRLSPDGGRIALTIGTGGRSDIWLYDIASATLQRLTNGGAQNERPEWTPDGRRVLYRSDRGQRAAIWWQPADLSGPATPLQSKERHSFYEGVISPDGKTIIYQEDDAGANSADVMYRALEGDTTEHAVAATSAVEAQPRLSPDDRWIAYVTDASGTSQVVVRPFPGPGGQVQVSVAGGGEPVWAPDGRRLFYRDGQHLIAASIATSPALTVTGRTELFEDNYVFAQAPHAGYDVSRDGTRFLMVKSVGTSSLAVVTGWLGEVQSLIESAGTQ